MENIKLKNDLFALQKSQEGVLKDCTKAEEAIECLKNQLRSTVDVKSKTEAANNRN